MPDRINCPNCNASILPSIQFCPKCGGRITSKVYKDEGLGDLYKILQVDPSAESEIIEAAYKRLATKYHPDINKSTDAPSRMVEINRAYKILGNKDLRKQYDEKRNSSNRETVISKESEESYRVPKDSNKYKSKNIESIPKKQETLESKRWPNNLIFLLIVFGFFSFLCALGYILSSMNKTTQNAQNNPPTTIIKSSTPFIITRTYPTNTPVPGVNSMAVFFGTIIGDSVNIRTGPGLGYAVITSFPSGKELQIVGKNENCSWLLINLPNKGTGWIKVDLLNHSVKCSQLLIYTVAIPLPTDLNMTPTPINCYENLVQVTIVNNTNKDVTLTLRGSCEYSYTIHVGKTPISIVPGNYLYVVWAGCGNFVIDGYHQFEDDQEWTWLCN
jgi:hypothetical protein